MSSNNDISLNAANSITQKGSHLLADNSISYKANNDITLQSSEDTHSSKHSYKDFSTSIEYGTNGFGMQANYSQENSKANSISQNNSTSYAKHITLNTDKSLNIISSNVESNTLEVNANSLKMESKYSTQYAKGNGVSTSLGYGSTTSNASSHTPQSPLNRFAKNAKSLNLSLGINSSNTDKEWIQTQASLLSQGSATINIRGNTHLAGGILSSRQEKLSLNTHSLTHSHLSSKDYNDSKAFSLSLSASDTELNLHNQGYKKEGIAYATLGYGHINIHTLNTANTPITLSNNNQTILSSTNIPSNTNPTNATINLADKANTPNTLDTAIIPNTPTPHTSLSGLNRNLSRSTTITKDTQTNALDSSLSIDNRIFSRNGREDIKNDFLELNDNIGQVGNALRHNIISQSIKNTLLDSSTTLGKEIQRYISSTNAINNLQQDSTLTHNLNNLTTLNPQHLQDTLQQAGDIASVGDGFGARVSLYNNTDTNLGYAYEPNQSIQYHSSQSSQPIYTSHSQNIIGFNTHTNNLNSSSSVINTIFHETTNKSLHTSNEQSAINRGNTAEGIWKLKNFNYIKESKREQREIAKQLRREQKAFTKEPNHNQVSQTTQQSTKIQAIHIAQNNSTPIDNYPTQTKPTTQKWNEIYADSATLLRGNDTYIQSTANASNGNGVVDERTIFVHGTWSNPKKAFDSSFRDGIRDILQDDRQEDFVWSGKNLSGFCQISRNFAIYRYGF